MILQKLENHYLVPGFQQGNFATYKKVDFAAI